MRKKATASFILEGFVVYFPQNEAKEGCRKAMLFSKKKALPRLPIFDIIMQAGNIPERDMYNTFNMGAGLVAAVAKEDADKAVLALNALGEKAYIIGECVAGDRGIDLY